MEIAGKCRSSQRKAVQAEKTAWAMSLEHKRIWHTRGIKQRSVWVEFYYKREGV